MQKERANEKFKLLVSDRSSRPLQLDHLYKTSLEHLLNTECEIRSDSSRIHLLLDCVLGLPRDVLQFKIFQNPRLNQGNPLQLMEHVFALAHSFVPDQSRDLFGRKAAFEFFKTHFPEAYPQPPKRICEIKLNANSVFKDKPFQKNIQTGTYRIWRDLGLSLEQEGPWFKLWPHCQNQIAASLDTTLIGEGYPSALWKKCINGPRTEPTGLVDWLEAKGFELTNQDRLVLLKNPDWADAAILAAALALEDGFPPSPSTIEGAIFSPG